MFFHTNTNTPYQWTTVGYSGLPTPPPYYQNYYQYPNVDAMGRNKGASLTPTYPLPFSAPAQQPSYAHPSHVSQPWRNNANQPSHDIDNQTPATYQPYPQYQNPQWAPQTLWTAPQQVPQPPQLQPQANAFRPGQSRYNLRTRPYSTLATDQVIQSIEADDVPGQLPIRQVNQRRTKRQSTPRRGNTPINEDITPVIAPEPSQTYLDSASAPPRKRLQPQKLLVLLDLNGTLVYRTGAMRRETVKRPGLDRLLNYLFANHVVAIFTSSTAKSADRMAKQFLTPQQYSQLAAIHTREHLGLTQEQFLNKVQVYKDLNTIWSLDEIKAAGNENSVVFDMTNTILIDDSVIKAKSHPYNLLQVAEFEEPEANLTKKKRAEFIQKETVAMRTVEEKLEALKWQMNVACLTREWQAVEQQRLKNASASSDDARTEFGKVVAAAAEQAAKLAGAPAAKSSGSRRARDAYVTPVRSVSGGSEVGEDTGDADADDDQWQGAKLPTPADELDDVKGEGEGSVTSRAARGQSPVTMKHFKWLSLEDVVEENGGHSDAKQ